VLLLIIVGITRIIDTYQTVSITADERHHIAAGVQWLVAGKYNYEEQHPPLARVFAALLPHLAGLTLFELRGFELDGDSLLLQTKDPKIALSLARSGILPFFILTCVVVYRWGKNIGGENFGLAALAIFSFTPTVLAISGVATTDMALCSTVTTSVYIYWRWLLKRSLGLTVLLGIFVGLSILAKLSAIVFLPVALLALYVGNRFVTRSDLTTKERKAPVVHHWVSAAIVIFLIVWSGYRFSFESINIHIPESMLSLALSSKLVSVQVPAPELIRGLWMLFKLQVVGHPAFLMNESSMSGWWYFFPVAIFFKTPLLVTALFCIGVVGLFITARQSVRKMIPIMFVLISLLVVVMPSSLNMVRYVLPVFPLIALIATSGLFQITRIVESKARAYSLELVLLSLIALSSVFTHPNYIAYFNILEKYIDGPILLSSDRDWGQGLWSLKSYVDDNQIQSIYVINSGMFETDINNYSLTGFKMLHPNHKVSGWVAAGYTKVFLHEGYKWLQSYKHVTVLDKSILVYHIPD